MLFYRGMIIVRFPWVFYKGIPIDILLENNNWEYPWLFHKEINRVVPIGILSGVIIIDEFLIL